MHLAIIGFGPRGLFSLENIINEVNNRGTLLNLNISIFDENNQLGTGLAWDLKQSQFNWINISDEALKNLPGRNSIVTDKFSIPSFPSYTSWCVQNFPSNTEEDKDAYPPRTQMGHYLNQRALTISKYLEKFKIITLIPTNVQELIWNGKGFSITCTNGKSYVSDECLLTIGHQPTMFTEEDKKNITHASERQLTYIHNPYIENVTSRAYESKNVVVIGFGLTMIDIMRMLTIEQGGRFVNKEGEYFLKYLEYSKAPEKIIPYSFDGLPCVPKPYGRSIDEQFTPSSNQKNRFKRDIEIAFKENGQNFTINNLLVPFAEVVIEIYDNIYPTKEISNLQYLIISWLKDEKANSSLYLDTHLPVRDYIIATIKMAMGDTDYTLDYVIGQVWRHLQPTMYRLFAFPDIKSETVKEIVAVDERTKRYSFGPPVESMLQTVALIDAGILDLTYVKDPDISRIENGWCLKTRGKRLCAEILINSVMDAPNLSQINSTIIKSLKNRDLIQSVTDELGIKTNSKAVAENNTSNIPLYVIGRNAKGSILGTDAILECFSPEIIDWAKHFANRV